MQKMHYLQVNKQHKINLAKMVKGNQIVILTICLRRMRLMLLNNLLQMLKIRQIKHRPLRMQHRKKQMHLEVRLIRQKQMQLNRRQIMRNPLLIRHRPLLMLLIRIIRWLDFWGMEPDFITEGDPNYTTVLCSNLGSIKCGSVYHHLNNYGTNSIMITVGVIHKEPREMPDGSIAMRDVMNLGFTADERIADGFYFAKSLKLLDYLLSNPALLEKEMKEELDLCPVK